MIVKTKAFMNQLEIKAARYIEKTLTLQESMNTTLVKFKNRGHQEERPQKISSLSILNGISLRPY
jgi:hypothetical protein